jgi:flagellar biosynthetic protein FliQ
MNPDAVVRLLRESLVMIVMLSAGPVGVALLVGLVASLLQAATSLQESTLSFVPKLLAVVAALAMLGPWMIAESVRYTRLMFEAVGLVR